MSRRPPDSARDPSPPSASTSAAAPARTSPPRPDLAAARAEGEGAPTSSSSTAVAPSSHAPRRRSPSPPVHPPLISSSGGPGTVAASLGIGLGRAPRAAERSRAERRASMDPYPAERRSPETSRRPSRAARTGRAQREEEEAETEMEGVEAVANETGVASPEASDKTFRLVVLQQPQIGAAAGLRRNTLGRLPIVPAPVVEVIVHDHAGERTDVELPYLFCSCSLRQEDGVSPVEVAAPEPSGDSEVAEEFSALIGQLVRNPRRVEDLDGSQKSVFVFEDVSVRTEGRFKLEFRLGEARRPKSPKLAAALSDTFDVVDWQQYPGRPAHEIVPPLSMHLHEQGVPVYIPPLLLAQPGELAPPPPSSNPFPANYSELDALAQVATASADLPPARPSSSRRPPASP